MLVLSRKKDETVVIGENIRLKITQIRGNRVNISIEAPKTVQIERAELKKKEE